MKPIDAIRARTDIANIATALGCKLNRKGDRFTAKWRDGDSFTVSLNREHGLFCDHKTGEGGDAFALVMLLLDCGFPEALRWLADFYGVPLEEPKRKSPSKRYREERQQATDAAEELSEFRRNLTVCLRELRNLGWDAFNQAERLYRGPNRAVDLPASEWRLLRRRLKLADERDRFITRLQSLPAAELIALRDRLEGSLAD